MLESRPSYPTAVAFAEGDPEDAETRAVEWTVERWGDVGG